LEPAPARAIETQVGVLGGQAGQLAHEVLGGDAPIADLVVYQQIHRVLGDVLEGVPVGASLPELRDGPGGLEVVHAAAPGGSGCSCGAGKGWGSGLPWNSISGSSREIGRASGRDR